MGRVKDLQIDLMNLEQSFLWIVERILLTDGYQHAPNRSTKLPTGMAGPDFVMISPNGKGLVAVELKLYRSDHVSTTLLSNAFGRLDQYVLLTGAVAGILVVTAPLTQSQAAMFRQPRLEVWDLTILTAKVRRDPSLAEAFFETIRSIQVGALGALLQQTELESLTDEEPPSAPAPAKEGEQLALKLEASIAGRRGKAAQAFEAMCQQSLELLYGEDFVGWQKQWAVEKGYQRLDLAARLRPVNGFWANLAGDFRTRYVIFEFKNYSAPIRQDEVHTTEKYLFTAAFRSVAIIIARKGDSPSAQRAMRGALREQGKLILCISMAELCGLLRGHDNGEDATNLLYSRLDEMLIAIAR